MSKQNRTLPLNEFVFFSSLFTFVVWKKKMVKNDVIPSSNFPLLRFEVLKFWFRKNFNMQEMLKSRKVYFISSLLFFFVVGLVILFICWNRTFFHLKHDYFLKCYSFLNRVNQYYLVKHSDFISQLKILSICFDWKWGHTIQARKSRDEWGVQQFASCTTIIHSRCR